MMSEDIANKSSQRSSWLKQKYMELNPDMRVQKTPVPSSFGDASSDLASRVGDVASKTGFTGDLTSMVGPSQGRLGMRGLNAQISNDMGDYASNANRNVDRVAGQWGKGMKLMGQSDARGRQVDRNELMLSRAYDDILKKNQEYDRSKPDAFGQIAGMVGNFAGGLIGRRSADYDEKKDGDYIDFLLRGG